MCVLNEYNSLLIVDLDAPHRYESAWVALHCGMMLRECLRHEPLARTVLFSEDYYCFFRYVELSTFDIASDAFASFKVGCTSTKHTKDCSHLFCHTQSHCTMKYLFSEIQVESVIDCNNV